MDSLVLDAEIVSSASSLSSKKGLVSFLLQDPLCLHDLLVYASNSNVVADATTLVLEIPQKDRQQLLLLLSFLPHECAVLAVAHCTVRRGRGGPKSKPPPLAGSNLDKKAAARRAANRKSAAISKLRQKVSNLAIRLMDARKQQQLEVTDADPAFSPTDSAAAAAAAGGSAHTQSAAGTHAPGVKHPPAHTSSTGPDTGSGTSQARAAALRVLRPLKLHSSLLSAEGAALEHEAAELQMVQWVISSHSASSSTALLGMQPVLTAEPPPATAGPRKVSVPAHAQGLQQQQQWDLTAPAAGPSPAAVNTGPEDPAAGPGLVSWPSEMLGRQTEQHLDLLAAAAAGASPALNAGPPPAAAGIRPTFLLSRTQGLDLRQNWDWAAAAAGASPAALNAGPPDVATGPRQVMSPSGMHGQQQQQLDPAATAAGTSRAPHARTTPAAVGPRQVLLPSQMHGLQPQQDWDLAAAAATAGASFASRGGSSGGRCASSRPPAGARAAAGPGLAASIMQGCQPQQQLGLAAGAAAGASAAALNAGPPVVPGTAPLSLHSQQLRLPAAAGGGAAEGVPAASSVPDAALFAAAPASTASTMQRQQWHLGTAAETSPDGYMPPMATSAGAAQAGYVGRGSMLLPGGAFASAAGMFASGGQSMSGLDCSPAGTQGPLGSSMLERSVSSNSSNLLQLPVGVQKGHGARQGLQQFAGSMPSVVGMAAFGTAGTGALGGSTDKLRLSCNMGAASLGLGAYALQTNGRQPSTFAPMQLQQGSMSANHSSSSAIPTYIASSGPGQLMPGRAMSAAPVAPGLLPTLPTAGTAARGTATIIAAPNGPRSGPMVGAQRNCFVDTNRFNPQQQRPQNARAHMHEAGFTAAGQHVSSDDVSAFLDFLPGLCAF